MKKNLSLFLVTIMVFGACSQPAIKKDTIEKSITTVETKLISDVLTREKQNELIPEKVIQSFKEGNERYVQNKLTSRDFAQQINKTSGGQYPEAIVLSCVDSRVPVEYIFDRGVGDIFVARVAGNFVNEDILGSMEFACKVSGSKLILVLGHEQCGAVKAAIDDVKLGNITPMLTKIKPSLKLISYDGDRSSKNDEFVQLACESNVKNTINEIRNKSSVLKEMEVNGEIKIMGAIYSLSTGKVTFLDI